MKRKISARALGATLAAALLAVLAMPSLASAQGLEVGGTGDHYFLNDEFTTVANHQFHLGLDTDRVYFGDWNGDGIDTALLRRGAQYFVTEKNIAPSPGRSFIYGRADDEVLVGDWDGDGRDTLAVRRGPQFHIRDSLSSGPADSIVIYGRDGDVVLVGDWDGDGSDTFAVRRGTEYHVRNSMASGVADRIVIYGRADDAVLVGDWDGDRRSSFAVRRASTYFIANEVRAGEADITVTYGRPTDVAFAGDWNGDGRDTLGVRRVASMPADPVNCDGQGGENAADPRTCQAMDRVRADLLGVVNAERATAGLPALALDPCLAEVAQHWSESMAWLQTTGSAHNPDLDADMRACGMRGWAENVARDVSSSPDARRVMDRWLASPPHYRNLTSTSVTRIGVGVASTGDGQWYYVLDFGRK